MLRNGIHMSTDLMKRLEVVYTVKFITDRSRMLLLHYLLEC